MLLLQFLPIFIGTMRKQYENILSPKASVAVLPIKGMISDSNRYAQYLHKFFKDPSIKAILLKIDSPGGAAGSAEAVHHELMRLKHAPEYPKKPVICLIENMCASGAYYIASASDYIISPATAVVGSIGATLPSIFFFQFKDFLAQHHIGYKPMAAGTFKNSIDPLSDMTPEQERMIQGLLDDTYNSFASDVAKNRKLSMNTKDSWANGRLFTGKQAKDLRLIDEIGSAYDAIRIIKEKALIEGDIEWITPPAQSMLSQVFGAESNIGDENNLFSAQTSYIAQFIGQLLQHTSWQ